MTAVVRGERTARAHHPRSITAEAEERHRLREEAP